MKDYKKPHEILNKITLGWNLGNHLDAHDKKYIIGTNNNKSVEKIVNLWHNPIFNLQCFDELKRHGINCVRIPVTWSNFIIIKNNKLSIRKDVFNYLNELISYGISKEFIIILDMHHDDQTWLKIATTNQEFKKVKLQYIELWKTIANEFKDYDENLIFEGMNEVVDRTDSENHDWWGKKNILFKRLNHLYKLFVKTIRNYGENNKNRTLMISTYGAQIHHHALKHFKMVKDKNTIVDMHYYTRHNTIQHFEEKFAPTFKYLTTKNIPIILGEIGTKKDCLTDFNIIETYLNFAKQHNIKCVLWDNGSSRSFINRETAQLSHKELVAYIKTQ